MPNIPTSKAKNVDELLVKESTEGLREKLDEYVLLYPNQKDEKEIINIYNKRLNHEIDIISKMKYSSYFLIVSDYKYIMFVIWSFVTWFLIYGFNSDMHLKINIK